MKNDGPYQGENLEQSIYSSKIASMGEMAGGVAHEINTPLATLMLIAGQCSDILNSSAPDLELLKRKIATIDTATHRITRIVAGMRAFCRDGQNDRLAHCKVTEVTETALSFLRERLTSQGIDLTQNHANPDLTITARATEISQVLLILLHNSQDALLESPETKWIDLKTKPLGAQAEITITDSGSGIPPEYRKKIFDPFFTTKHSHQKIGLSLSIAKRIIEAHGGTITLDNHCDHTRFIITLPQ